MGNVGEDLKGSARHKRNAWRTLAEAEADGTAAALVTRDKLLKAEPLDLTEGLTNANYLTRLAGHLALKSFPAQPYTDKVFQRYERGSYPGKKSPAEMREIYYNHLQEVKGIIDKRRDDADPRDMLSEIANATVERIRAIRGDRFKNTADPFNPLANSLVDLSKKASRGGYAKSSIAGQMNTLGARLRKANDGKSIADLADVMRNATEEILGGASIDKVTGVQRGGATINAADLYVKRAVRTGGRSLGVDDTPAGSTTVLANRIGMRGLQFGNSVTDDERAHHLRKTAEALVDLADVTGLPDRAISLDGQLGLAFGARGKGRASAHYEPGNKVINITRKNGVGTLAHEWGHALDNYIGEKSARLSGFMSEARSPRVYGRDDLSDMSNDPVWKAMDGVRKAIDATGFHDQVRQGLREARIKPGSGQWNYWTQDIEVFARCFERHVQHKLRSKGQENTYLSGLGGDSKLWPSTEQAKQLAPAFDELMQAVGTNTFGSMKRRTDSREQRIQRLVKEAYQAAAADCRANASLQQRIDAAKRKCTTGYSCGAGCISMNKQCRKTPSAGPGQQKMTRILALAQPGRTLAPPAADSPTQQLRQAASRHTKPTAQQKPSTTNKTPTAKPKGRALAGLQSSADYEQTIRSSATDAAAVAAHKAARALDNTSRGQSRKAFETEMGGRNQASQAITEITNFTGLNYSAIRAAQRNDASVFKDQAQMEEYSGKAATIEKAVRSMPKPDVTKYRGITASDSYLKQLVAKAEAGGTLKNDALDSWSTSLRIADDFSKKYADNASPNAAVFRAQNKTGASVKAFSAAKQEDEILTPSGSSYRITGYRSIVQGGKSVHIFDLEET